MGDALLLYLTHTFCGGNSYHVKTHTHTRAKAQAQAHTRTRTSFGSPYMNLHMAHHA